MDKLDYIQFVSDKEGPCYSVQTLNEIEFQMKFVPDDLQILNSNEELDQNLYEELKQEYKNIAFFTLDIKTKNSSDLLKYNLVEQEEYFQRIEYYSFRIKNDLYLATETDTIHPILYHFERDYGLTPRVKVNLAFESQDSIFNDKIIYYDRIFNKDYIYFSFDELDDLPQLSLNENL